VWVQEQISGRGSWNPPEAKADLLMSATILMFWKNKISELKENP